MKNTRSFIGLIAVVGLILLLVSTYQPANTQANNQIIVYTIDRAAVPLLYHNDLTLIVNVGDAQSISVLDENGSAIPFQAGPAAQEITFSTDSDTVRLNLNTVQPSPSLGEFRKAPLKNNFLWAYSHGFDDNYGLDDTRNAFLERDVPATYNIVADWVKVIPGWPGDFTPAELDEILDAGWGLNNHTWDHEMADFEGANGCSDTSLTYADRKADVLATADRLEQIL
ncbi:MAG: polysaccharide deacetylase family protein, partial [Chloroflexota bacterium]